MKFKFILILFVLLFPFKSQSQQTNLPDSTISNLQSKIEAQNSHINKLDSILTLMKNENAHLKELAEQDIDHAKSLINSTETVVEFIAVLLAIFTVVGGFIIAKMFRQSSQINKDHKMLLGDWEKIRTEIQNLKESSVKEGKELLQILFYVTEGDYQFEDDPEEAISYYQRALKVRGDNPEIYAKLGHANLTLGRYDQAISQLEKGYKIAPDNISILNALARANRKLKRYDKAEYFSKKVLEINDEDIWALRVLARIYLIKRDYENAKDISEKLLLKDFTEIPNSNLAIIYAFYKDNDNAKFHFEKTLTIIEKKLSQSPENKWLIINKVIQLIGLSRLIEADQLLTNLKKRGLFPTHIEFIVERLNILYDIFKNKKIEKMISIFENNK